MMRVKLLLISTEYLNHGLQTTLFPDCDLPKGLSFVVQKSEIPELSRNFRKLTTNGDVPGILDFIQSNVFRRQSSGISTYVR